MSGLPFRWVVFESGGLMVEFGDTNGGRVLAAPAARRRYCSQRVWLVTNTLVVVTRMFVIVRYEPDPL